MCCLDTGEVRAISGRKRQFAEDHAVRELRFPFRLIRELGDPVLAEFLLDEAGDDVWFRFGRLQFSAAD